MRLVWRWQTRIRISIGSSAGFGPAETVRCGLWGGFSKEPVTLMENYLLGCETRDSERDQAF